MNTASPLLKEFRAERLESIDALPAAAWNALDGTRQAFLRHEFLAALEHSGAVGAGSGWLPQHIVLHGPDGRLAGALPLYLKSDSWGEFVFDFAWADAYHRAGLRYYPKLVAAVPYTPVTGPRVLVAPGTDPDAVTGALAAAARRAAEDLEASSLHVLFPDIDQARALEAAGLMLRKDCQFHWHNRNYGSFDDFLQTFTSAKRKKVKRERRRVAESGIRFRWLTGADIDRRLWQVIMPLYASSFRRRGRDPYLGLNCLMEISAGLPEQLIVILAEHHGEPIAVAICFRSDDALYGRYWGSTGHYHSLHFETCYYQGIEFCIAEGLSRFEPGTQGEHKIARGFVPTATWSAHWLTHPQFAAAIDDYLDRERDYVDEYMEAVNRHVPYRKSDA